MEIDDCAFPLVHDIVPTSDLKTAFDGTSWALLVGSIPRKAGMERGDLLSVNGGIFKPQGRAIAENAASDVRILVVGNPCNTNCLIARSNAPEVPAERWFAMTRLDENRAKAQLAAKANAPVADVTQRGDLGQPFGHPVPGLRQRQDRWQGCDRGDHRHEWLEGDFITTVQKRGAAIIDARGSSSAASAASAAIDTVVSLRTATAPGDCLLRGRRQLGPVRRSRGPPVRLPGRVRRQGRLVRGRGLLAQRIRPGAHRGHDRRAARPSATTSRGLG